MAWDTGAPNTSLLTTYLIKKFIPALEAELTLSKFTTKAIIPPGSGKIGRFNVFNNPPGTTTALSDGADFFSHPNTLNQITTLTTTGTDVTIAEYGEYIKVSSLMELTQVSTARSELVQRMTYGGALSIDRLVSAQMDATTVSYFAGDLALDSVTPVNLGLHSLMETKAAKLQAISFSGGLTAAKGFTGVSGHRDGNFAAFITPTAEADMTTEGTTSHITWQNAVVNVPGMGGQERWVKGAVGECYGMTVYTSQVIDEITDVTITASVQANFVMGEGAVGAVGFNDMDPRIIVNDINSPYKNSKSIAWKAYFGTGLIDANRVVKLYSVT